LQHLMTFFRVSGETAAGRKGDGKQHVSLTLNPAFKQDGQHQNSSGHNKVEEEANFAPF
jgi:hypothetical protein